MKKTLAMALAFVLIVSCVFTGIQFGAPADADSPEGINSVTVAVKEQNGKFGGAITTEATQYIPEGELATVSATPYYGNGFLGWYEGSTLVSQNLNYSFAPTKDTTLTAVFDIKNMVENADAEVFSYQSVLTNSINNFTPKYNTADFGTASIISSGGIANTDDDFGDYVLKLTPSQATGTSAASKVKNLANFKMQVKKNTDYIIRFSYKFDDNANFSTSGTTYALHMALNAPDSNGKIPYTDTRHGIKWSFHSQQHATPTDETNSMFKSLYSWGGSDGYDATAEQCDKYFTDNGLGAKAVWQDVFVLVNPGEDANIFKNGSDEGVMFFSLGTHYNNTDFILLDNLLISEAEANDKSTVSAGKHGSVQGISPRTTENYYTYTDGKRGDSDVYTNRDTANLFYPTAYECFVATEADGAEFIGWFDENGERVSEEKRAYLLMTGKEYTAKFATDIAAEGGGVLVDNGDGTYTAKAFYGNKFLGWFDGTTTPYTFKTSEPTLEKAGHLGYVAMFSSDNLIYDGDFEVNANTAKIYNDYIDYDAICTGTNAIVSTLSGSTPEFGESALQITPAQASHASKRKGLVNIPVTLEKDKTYLWKFSYAITAASYNANRDYLYLSVDPADANGKVPWTSNGGTKYSYHVQLASHNGVNTNNYAWGDWQSDAKTHYSTTKAISTVNAWVDVFVIFTAEKDGTHFLTLGCDDSQTNAFLFDNMSCSLAAKNPTSLTKATAGANGKVYSYRTSEKAHTTSATRGTADIYAKYVDTANSYYADIYADYFATPDVGFLFDGWYDKNGALVTTSPVLRVKLVSNEEYTAKFKTDPTEYTVTAGIETENGVYGGYIVGEKTANARYGAKVTFTAVTYQGNTFKGWYVGTEKVADTETIEYTVRKNAELKAHFEIGNLYPDSGMENAAAGDSVGEATVVTNEFVSGKNALMVNPTCKEFVLPAILADTNKSYVLSFMWKAASGDFTLDSVKITGIGGAIITEKIINAAGKGEWVKALVPINSGSHDVLKIAISYSSTLGTTLYLDDIVLCDASVSDFTVTAAVEKQDGIFGGYIEGAKEITARYGTNVTVKAVAYERNAFLGWYDGETLLSTDAEYTFAIDGFRDLKARFDIKNLWPDAGYENTTPDISLSENGDWVVNESLHNKYNFDVTVTNQGSIWEGKQMLSALHRGNPFSTKIAGLKANTNYFLTFRVRTHKTLDNCYFQHAKIVGTYNKETLGTGFGTANGGQWEFISVPFNTGNNTEISIELVYQAGEEACYFDNFALYEANNIGVYAGDGGTVSSTLNGGQNGPAITGTSVTLTATPDGGNTFLGWYDYKNSTKLLSTANPYTFEVTDSQHILAKFAGDSVEGENMIVDGDFENGVFDGFIFTGTTATASCDFCVAQVTKKVGAIEPVSGDYMVKLTANSRKSSLIVENLKPHTDYTLSFYWLGNEYINVDYVAAYRYLREKEYHLMQDTKKNAINPMLLYQLTDMRTGDYYISEVGEGDGKNWRRVELTFNTGNRSEALISLSYSRKGGNDGLYLDNLKLTEGSKYSGELQNGDFSNGKTGWYGDLTVQDGVAATNSSFYQGVVMDTLKGYTLTFKARAENAAPLLFGMAAGGEKLLVDNGKDKSYSGVSSATANLTTEWKEYSVSFLSSTYPNGYIVFQSLIGDAVEIKDVKFAPATSLVAVDKITFDSDTIRDICNAAFESVLSPNAHKNPKNPDWYEISNDSHSGDGSLMMKANSNFAYHAFSQPFAIFNLESGRSYRVSFYAKAETAGVEFKSGIVYTGPSYVLEYPANETIKLETTDWTKITYTFTMGNVTHAACNTANWFVDGIEGKTNCNILFDDVLVEEYEGSVINKAPENLYTQDLSQNYFANYSFEKDGDIFAPFVKSGDAAFGNRYITLNAGDKLVLPVNTRTSYDLTWNATYIFAADIRGGANAKGTVSLSYSADGKQLFRDANGEAVSLALNTNGKWQRSGFEFSGYRLETEYLVLECTEGSFDVDYIALFNASRGFKQNTHDLSTSPSKDELPVSDMGAGNSNYVTGTLSGLPEGSKVVFEGKTIYSQVLTDGFYRIDGIKNGTYTMYIAPANSDILTLWGDLTVEDGFLSGLAVTRLYGEVEEVSGSGKADAIVKITDNETVNSYLTATDNDGNYVAYILYCDYTVDGITADEAVLEQFGITLEQFGAEKAAAEDEKSDESAEQEEEKTITKIIKEKGKKADNTLSVILMIAAGAVAVIAAAVLLVLNRKKEVRG